MDVAVAKTFIFSDEPQINHFLFFHIHLSVEQIKSSPEVREKIIAASKNARKASIYPAEIQQNDITCYAKDHHGIVMDDFKHLHSLIKDDHILTNGGNDNNKIIIIIEKNARLTCIIRALVNC
jgi:hypothetical protein